MIESDRSGSRIPGLDRRALERLAVGAPKPGRPRLKRTPGLRVGGLRRTARARSRPAPPPTGSVPLSSPPLAARERLLLAVVAPSVRGTDAATDALLATAVELAADRTLVVVDLDAGRPALAARLGAGGREGLVDVLEFGASLRSLLRPAEEGLHHLPLGVAPDPAALAGHPGWGRLLREAGRRGLTLLAHLPAEARGLDALATLADAAVLVAPEGDDEGARAALAPGLPIVRSVALPPEDEAAPVAEVPVEEGPVGVREEAPPEEAPPAEPTPEAGEVLAGGAGLRAAEWEPVEIEAIPAAAEGTPEGELDAPRLGPRPARYVVPRVPGWWEATLRVAAVLVLAYWSYYIVWRWTGTLNLDALWFSVPLVLAESWGLLAAVLLVFTTWRLNHRTALPAPADLAVDVVVTTRDEPLAIVRRTVAAARDIRYPHRTYLLDEGRRDELRAVAGELGVGYLRRERDGHAPGGSPSQPPERTPGDFVLQLDADHAPLPQILDRVLGFFGDPRVAFVQTPQDFHDVDPAAELDGAAHRLWEEQRLFSAVVQPGKDRFGAALLRGSCAVIRREALDEIGGVSAGSAAGDLETSLLLHSRGWRSVYYGESLAYRLAAGAADPSHARHERRARGAMRLLRAFGPIRHPGLTPAQRIGYFHSLTTYVAGLQRLVLYAAPIVFFLTGVLPVASLDRAFLLRFVPYLVLSVALAELLARGVGFTWPIERHMMAQFWTYTRALPAYLTRRRASSRAAPGGPGWSSASAHLPQLVLMGATVFAVNWATLAHRDGWIDYGAPGWRSLAFQANFLWALLNFVLAAAVVWLGIRAQRRRQDHRRADRFPIRVRPRGARGELGDLEIALTEELNPAGLTFRSVAAFEVGAELKLTLPLSAGEVPVEAVVVHAEPDPGSGVAIHRHGVEFRDVPFHVREALERHCAHHAGRTGPLRHQSRAPLPTRAREWARAASGGPRRRVRLPTWVRVGAGDGAEPRREVASLEEVSRGGARLIMDRPVAPGTPMAFSVPGTGVRGEGRAVFSRALETPVGVRFAVGMRREAGADRGPRADRRLPGRWRAAGAATSLLAALGMLAIP